MRSLVTLLFSRVTKSDDPLSGLRVELQLGLAAWKQHLLIFYLSIEYRIAASKNESYEASH